MPGGMYCRNPRQPRSVPAVRAGRRAARTVPSSSRHARCARAVTAKAAPRSTPHPSSLRQPPAQGASISEEGVRSARIAGSRHSGTAGRATRQGRPASRFMSVARRRRPSPLSFLNDLIRPSTPSNPRSFGPSCRVPRLPAPPLRSGFPCASSRFRWRGRLAVFWCSVEGTDPPASKEPRRNAEPSSSSPATSAPRLKSAPPRAAPRSPTSPSPRAPSAIRTARP